MALKLTNPKDRPPAPPEEPKPASRRKAKSKKATPASRKGKQQAAANQIRRKRDQVLAASEKIAAQAEQDAETAAVTGELPAGADERKTVLRALKVWDQVLIILSDSLFLMGKTDDEKAKMNPARHVPVKTMKDLSDAATIAKGPVAVFAAAAAKAAEEERDEDQHDWMKSLAEEFNRAEKEGKGGPFEGYLPVEEKRGSTAFRTPDKTTRRDDDETVN